MAIEITDRISAIRGKKIELDAKRRQEEDVMMNRKVFLLAKIKQYSQDFDNLVTLADELQTNGFSLNDSRSNFGDTSSFCTDGIQHGVGFFTRNPWAQVKEIIGFGIENGGAFGSIDLLIDFNGNVVTKGEVYGNGRLESIERFVKYFPDFKQRFLAYVDKITK